MPSFQTILALLMAAMVNSAYAALGIHATSILVLPALVDVVISSALQHSVIAAAGPGPAKTTHLLHRRANDTGGGCFHDSNFTDPDDDASTWVPWAALASQQEPDAEVALFQTLTAVCQKISATILTRGIAYTHCEPDAYTNGTYEIIAQMTYLGPGDVFDMRGVHDHCLAAMSVAKDCEYGGSFEEVHLFYGAPNNTQFWTVQARPIVGPCPDCTGGLLS